MKTTTTLTGLLVLALTLSTGAPALAEDMSGSMTWLAFDKVKSGSSQAYIGMMIENDGPMYDAMMADGTIQSWGIALPIHHGQNDPWNIFTWIVLDDWAKVEALEGGIMKTFAERGPEKMAELNRAYHEATVAGSHHDQIVHNAVRNINMSVQPNYLRVGYFTATEGNAGSVVEWYKANVAPIYDQLSAEGVISGYGMHVQELHGQGDWTNVNWVAVPGLGGLDKVAAAFEEGLSEEAMGEIMGMMESGSHWDQVLKIVHLGGATAE